MHSTLPYLTAHTRSLCDAAVLGWRLSTIWRRRFAICSLLHSTGSSRRSVRTRLIDGRSPRTASGGDRRRAASRRHPAGSRAVSRRHPADSRRHLQKGPSARTMRTTDVSAPARRSRIDKDNEIDAGLRERLQRDGRARLRAARPSKGEKREIAHHLLAVETATGGITSSASTKCALDDARIRQRKRRHRLDG